MDGLSEGSSELNQETKEQNESQDVKCISCGESFQARFKLQLHMLKTHADKNQQCMTCERTFGALNNLRLHLRNTHGGKLVKCDFCDKTYIGEDGFL